MTALSFKLVTINKIMKDKIIILICLLCVFINAVSPMHVLAAESSGGSSSGEIGYYSIRTETESGVVYYRPDKKAPSSDYYYYHPAIFKIEGGYTLCFFKEGQPTYITAQGKIIGVMMRKDFKNLYDVEYELFEKGVQNNFEGYELIVGEQWVYQTVMIDENLVDGDGGEYTGPNGDTSIIKKTLTEYYQEYRIRNPIEDLETTNKGNYIICQYYQTILPDSGKDNEKEYKYALIKIPDVVEEINVLNEAEKLDLKLENIFKDSAIDSAKYAISTHGFFDVNYDDSHKFKIYTFDSLKDAVMYQLYNKPPNDSNGVPQALLYNENHYAVNIIDFLYSNVQVGDFYNPIDEDNYKYVDNYVVFKQHNSQTYFKVYFEYKPWINTLMRDEKGRYKFDLQDNELSYIKDYDNFTWVRIYEGAFDDEGNSIVETSSADGWEFVSSDDEYYFNRFTWYLYSPKAEEQWDNEILHDIVFATNEANLLDFHYDENGNWNGGMSSEQILHNVVDENGDRFTYNEITNEYIKEDEYYDPYKDPDGDGIYENSKGDKLDPSELTDLTQNRLDQQSLDAGLNGIIGAFAKFSEMIKEFSVQMKNAGNLINALIRQIPVEFISLIGLSVIAFIIIRLIRQRE